ncbi:MAG TPA: aldolase/citrate lyase family protein [Bacteroidales bacterium]|nr:aldolase/citrate lyase family protein [Bacteroidales bacterium]
MADKERFNKPMIGALLSISAPQVAEIIALAGFDWVFIDMEHSAMSLESVQNAIQIMEGKVLTIVRVPANDEVWIKRILDTGCDGILVPMVNSADEAKRVVQASKYPPEGRRSVGLARAHKYGATFSEYVAKANSELIVIIQCEHKEAVRNFDEILKVDGIDSVFIGPYDLSASMGLTGQITHPDVIASIRLVKEKCRMAGRPYGIFSMNKETLKNEIKEGCTFLLSGVDANFLLNAFTGHLKELK